jgi:hypothetical protein
MLGEAPGQEVKLRGITRREIEVGEVKHLVSVAEIEIADKDIRRVILLSTHEAPQPPFVLARESTSFDRDDRQLGETAVTTEEIGTPRLVLGHRHRTWTTQTIQKHSGGRTVTREVHAAEVPGGVIEHESQEYDADGKLLRRSTLELLSYGVVQAERSGLRRRHDDRRSRRRMR